MKLVAVNPALVRSSGDSRERTLSFSAGDSWASRLELGQILNGRVLRSFEDGRYEVKFGNEKRVVDSSIPFSAGDVLRGRVVGLGSTVTIERIPQETSRAVMDDRMPPASLRNSVAGEGLAAQAARLNIDLSPGQMALIARAARGQASPASVLRAGLFLARLGLPQSVEVIRGLAERMTASAGGMAPPDRALVATLEVLPTAESAQAGGLAGPLVSALGRWMMGSRDAAGNPEPRSLQRQEEALENKATEQGLLGQMDQRESGRAAGGGDGEAGGGAYRTLESITAALLNVQTGARTGHAFKTLPVMIGGRLVEFDLALFDQGARDGDGLDPKRFRFSLDTEFGPVDIDARTLNGSVQIAFTAESARLLQGLQDGEDALSEGLQLQGWSLDGVRCASGRRREGVAASIVDHVLEQDSLRMAL